MNPFILKPETQAFINQHLNANIADLILKKSVYTTEDLKLIIEQIEAKKRCQKKLPTWFNTPNIYYPNKLNIEQTSSKITAQYKASLINGDTLIDLTGGYGVDCLCFSKKVKNITHCEINETLSNIVKHNYNVLQADNIKTVFGSGIDYIKNNLKNYDWIYIDPSRRHDSKGKVFFLNDCLPNVPKHIDLLFSKTNNVLIKTSPLLDLSIGINELKHVKTIHIVAVNNEVKELLWVLEQGFNSKINIETVNIKKDKKDVFNFYLDDEKQASPAYHLPLNYIYEPNAAILKSGAFNTIAKHLNVYKLHKHSHLYTSKSDVEFPGRRFKIEAIIPYNKKKLKKLNLTKANITTRNFPDRVEDIRKKLKIKDGGDTYLFFTTDINNEKIVVITQKAK